MHGGTDWTCEPDSGRFIPRCSMMFRNNIYGNQCANMQANKQTTMLFLVWHFDISGYIRGIPRFNIFESLNEMIHQNNSNSPTHGHCSNIVTSPDLTGNCWFSWRIPQECPEFRLVIVILCNFQVSYWWLYWWLYRWLYRYIYIYSIFTL